MIIHVVKNGETVNSIARSYGVPVSRIIRDNELGNPDALAVGQTLVILYHDRVYTVKEGDSLSSVAAMYGTTVDALLRNNPSLDGLGDIYPGQTLVISLTGEKLNGEYSVGGYAYPFIDADTYRRTLPFLTDAAVFSYGFTNEGELVVPDDVGLVRLANAYGTTPMIVFTTLTPEGTFNSELTTLLFGNDELRSGIIDELRNTVNEKGYGGIDMDFEYIPAQNREGYVNFIRELADVMHADGKLVSVALPPKTSDDQAGLLYEGIDYAALGEAADYVLLMTYEYGYTYGPPMAVAPLPPVRRVLDYAVTRIPREKIRMGIPNYGYDWKLPYVRGESKARSLGNTEAVQLAYDVGAEIMYDNDAQSPYFNYTANGSEHVVWFEDARSIDAKLRTAAEYRLGGVGYWNIMKYFPQNWLVLNSLYNIKRD